MFDLLYLIPLLPFAGFLILALAGRRLPRQVVAVIGCGTVGLAAILVFVLGTRFILSPPAGGAYVQTLGTWIAAGNVAVSVSLSLDALSLLMTFVITFVGFLIHLYSTEFMRDDEGYSRFFAWLNLFVGSMLTLVLAGNLLLLYLGWEGVGLCSYLLIGFWREDPANGRAARKAFVTTRIGDTALMIGLILLFSRFGTLDIRDIVRNAPFFLAQQPALATAAAALLFGGAVGKSAQLPLQVWLPDAMAGPTPVSALIHAATMVTAGVYLVARMHALFVLAPAVMQAVAIVGAITLLVAGTSALAQRDLKRVLAYSTISQLGYMFLALGVGAWSAALFHFMTHAFFKALLFLGAGAIINAQHHEHDMFRMGGLRKVLPLTFWTFLIGSASLAALPLVTAGFYSKDLILWDAWASPQGSAWLWAAGFAGAFITALYTGRMLFLVFFGESRTAVGSLPGRSMQLPLFVLAVLATLAGFVETPRFLGDAHWFSSFLQTVLPPLHAPENDRREMLLLLATQVVQIAALVIAYVLYLRMPRRQETAGTGIVGALRSFLFAGWGFDWMYAKMFVDPFTRIAALNKRDVIDRPYRAIARATTALHELLRSSQTGRLRWYAGGIVLGAVILLGIVLFT